MFILKPVCYPFITIQLLNISFNTGQSEDRSFNFSEHIHTSIQQTLNPDYIDVPIQASTLFLEPYDENTTPIPFPLSDRNLLSSTFTDIPLELSIQAPPNQTHSPTNVLNYPGRY